MMEEKGDGGKLQLQEGGECHVSPEIAPGLADAAGRIRAFESVPVRICPMDA
jgi:hypothetical protein